MGDRNVSFHEVEHILFAMHWLSRINGLLDQLELSSLVARRGHEAVDVVVQGCCIEPAHSAQVLENKDLFYVIKTLRENFDSVNDERAFLSFGLVLGRMTPAGHVAAKLPSDRGQSAPRPQAERRRSHSRNLAGSCHAPSPCAYPPRKPQGVSSHTANIHG
jgi:hypothetical protein